MHTYDYHAALHDAQLLHRNPGRVALGERWDDAAGQRQWRSWLVDVDDLPRELERIEALPGHSYYTSQHTMRLGAGGRRVADVGWLNACWLDIDLVQGADSPSSPLVVSGGPAGFVSDPMPLAALLHRQLMAAGLPAPSLVTYSGRGLHVKWMFDAVNAFARGALSRWGVLNTQLTHVVAGMRFQQAAYAGRVLEWPVDAHARDAARVLRLAGTVNPSTSTLCCTLIEGERCEYAALATRVEQLHTQLPRTAPAPSPRMRRAPVPLQELGCPVQHGETVRADTRRRWARWLDFSERVLRERGGAVEGLRDKIFWRLANAAAWCAPTLDALRGEIDRLHAAHFSKAAATPFTLADARAAASSVVARWGTPLNRAGDTFTSGLYVMKLDTFLEPLAPTAAEMEQYGHLLVGREPRPNPGVMELPPLAVPANEFAGAVRARKSIGGRYTQSRLSTARGYFDLRPHALELAAAGERPATIGRELSVPVRTVRDWLKVHEGRVQQHARWEVEAAAAAEREAAAQQDHETKIAQIYAALQARGTGGPK